MGTRGLFLDANERPVTDWRPAAWKTCSTCSRLARKHVFLRFPQAYGGAGTRTHASGKVEPENNCYFHRPYKDGKQVNPGPNREPERRECCGRGVLAVSSPKNTAPARPPIRRPAHARLPEDEADAAWTDDDLKGLVRLLVAMPLDEEGERKLVEHVRLERSARTRKQFLEERRRQGRVRCDACAEDLAQKYDSTFSEVVEVHHRVPLWKGVQKATGEMLALLCPTCHRVVHFRQKEPRAVEEVARLVRRSGEDGARAGSMP